MRKSKHFTYHQRHFDVMADSQTNPEIDTAEVQNKKTERANANLEAANKDLYDKVAEEQGLREAKERELTKALNEKKALEDAAATDAAELAQLRQEIEELKKTAEESEKAAKDLAGNLKNVEDGYGELQEALRTALDGQEEVRKQLKAQQEQNDELAAQRAGVDQLLHDTEQENLSLQNAAAERDQAQENLQQLEEMFAEEFKVHSEGLDFDVYLRNLAEAVQNGTRLRREESQTSLRSEESQSFGEPSRARRSTGRGNNHQVSTNSLGDELAAMEGGEEFDEDYEDELYANGDVTIHAGNGNLTRSLSGEKKKKKKKGRLTCPSEPTNNDSYDGTVTYYHLDEHNVVPGTGTQVPKDWNEPDSTIKVPATSPVSIAPVPVPAAAPPPADESAAMAENRNLRARLASMQGTLDLRQKDREDAVRNAHIISQKARGLRKEIQDLKDENDRLKTAPLIDEAVASRDTQLNAQAERLKQQHDWLQHSAQRIQSLEGELKTWQDSWHHETQKAVHVIGLKDEEIQHLGGILNRPRGERSTQTDPEPSAAVSTTSTGVQTDESRKVVPESVHHATQTDARSTAPSYVSTGTVTAALPAAQLPPSSHAGVQTTEPWPMPVVEIVQSAPEPAVQPTPWWLLVQVGVAALLLAWMLGLGGGAGRWEAMNDVRRMGLRVRTAGVGVRTPWEGVAWGWICAVLGVEGSLVG